MHPVTSPFLGVSHGGQINVFGNLISVKLEHRRGKITRGTEEGRVFRTKSSRGFLEPGNPKCMQAEAFGGNYLDVPGPTTTGSDDPNGGDRTIRS